jgi:RNA polymerase sigma factor (sigma-70 family)
MNDSELLRCFAEEHSEPAFAELVGRRVGLVYSAALRQLNGDAHRAEDVTQTVFIDLARKARSLCRHPALIGWLYTSTHHAAAKMLRAEQRRTRREQEAQAMHDINATTATDWERVRPVLDAAMLELGERDRDAVLLRFFSGQSFASIAAELGVTENAVQKSTGRALDQLHAALARRGVTSTTAALATVLTSQASTAVPTSLAAAVTGAALAGSAAGTAGILGFMSGSKIVAGFTAGVTAVALSIAVVEYRAKHDAAAALASAERQRQTIQAELAQMNARLAQAERRAADAERDSGDLLKAVESLRAGQAAQAARAATATGAVAGSGSSGIVGMVQDARDASPEEKERAAYERSYQQALARRRAMEAKTWAQIDQEAATTPDALALYNRLIEMAEHMAATGEFQSGVKMYNRALQAKPADLAVSDRVQQLQATLAGQNTPVELTLASDGLTWVSIVNVHSPRKFTTTSVRTLPGNYEVIGQRFGYQNVVIPLQVRNGIPAPLISVACNVPVAP